jgi:hypothetical protein
MLGCMPSERDQLPPEKPSPRPKLFDNPFMKSAWNREDLFLVLLIAQVSSGRRGKDATAAAESTLKALDDEHAKGGESGWNRQ